MDPDKGGQKECGSGNIYIVYMSWVHFYRKEIFLALHWIGIYLLRSVQDGQKKEFYNSSKVLCYAFIVIFIIMLQKNTKK